MVSRNVAMLSRDEEPTEETDPCRCGMIGGRAVAGGAFDERRPRDVDASEARRWYRYAVDTVVCSSCVPGLIVTGEPEKDVRAPPPPGVALRKDDDVIQIEDCRRSLDSSGKIC